MPVRCDAAIPAVADYLHEHGIQWQGSPLDSHILDVNGKRIEKLWARANVHSKPNEGGCLVDLKIWFGNGSGHLGFVGIFPIDSGEWWLSNGKLEEDFLEQMAVLLAKK